MTGKITPLKKGKSSEPKLLFFGGEVPSMLVGEDASGWSKPSESPSSETPTTR